MSLKCTQIFDATNIDGNEADNVFDRAFGAYNVEVQRKNEEGTKYNLKLVEIAVTDVFELSRSANGDIRPAGLHRSLSSFVDISPSSNASPINSFVTIPSLLSSNTTLDFNGSPQTANPWLCTGRETGTTGSQNIPGGHQQHGHGDSSEVPRQLDLELRETDWSPSPFTASQQTPNSMKLSSLRSPANPLPTVKAFEEAPILDESGQKIPTPKGQRKNVLNTKDIKRTSPKDSRRSRKVSAQTKREVAAKREGQLLRNRQAAHKCREDKKTQVSDLLRREEFSIRNNAKLTYEIEQTMLELRGLRAIATEHYRVCPIPSPELAAWFEKEVVRRQHSNVSALTHHANQSLTRPPQDTNYTSQGTADMLPLSDLRPLRQDSDDSAPIGPSRQHENCKKLDILDERDEYQSIIVGRSCDPHKKYG
jgi:hypothetical protein